MARQLHVAVVGGGWAGCAAAVELSAHGHRVCLLEAARTLGGRARTLGIRGKQLDNGQHIMLGAYTALLGLLRKLRVQESEALQRLPVQMCYPNGMQLIAQPLAGPMHLIVGLLLAKGLSRADKMSLARFVSAARWMDWQLHADCSVEEMLQRLDQTEPTIRLFWAPLCLAALNTPASRASAKVFLSVLRDSIGAKRRASDMLLPRQDLSRLFPEKARDYVEKAGGRVKTGVQVSSLHQDGELWTLQCRNRSEPQAGFDAVILAVAPAAALPLLQDWTDTSALQQFTYEPITTCYLQYPQAITLGRPMFALQDNPEQAEWGQFVFDRGALDPDHAGLVAVVVSASQEVVGMDAAVLSGQIAQQLARAFDRPELAAPLWTQIICEKRATFSCRPGLRRPGNATEVAGLLIAGDYTASDYPATLETAVRSGVDAARLLISGAQSRT